MNARFVLPIACAFLLAGCSGEPDSTRAGEEPVTGAATSDGSAQSSDPATSVTDAEGTCPLTLPNRSTPPDATDWQARDSYGNGKLWTLFWPHNVVVAEDGFVQDDGAISMKWPWWRGLDGELEIEGRRLDGSAPPLTADIPDGYGTSGFQPSGILFATEGCWEVTGAVAGAKLTFVTLVVKASAYGLKPDYE